MYKEAKTRNKMIVKHIGITGGDGRVIASTHTGLTQHSRKV